MIDEKKLIKRLEERIKENTNENMSYKIPYFGLEIALNIVNQLAEEYIIVCNSKQLDVFDEIKERVCVFIHEKYYNETTPCKNQIESCLQRIRLCDLARIINQVKDEYNNRSINASTDCSTNNGWIPCSERLPEPECSRHVWLSFTNQYCSYTKEAIWEWDKFVWMNGKEVKDEPVAWKLYSRPEPYQPKGENDHD